MRIGTPCNKLVAFNRINFPSPGTATPRRTQTAFEAARESSSPKNCTRYFHMATCGQRKRLPGSISEAKLPSLSHNSFVSGSQLDEGWPFSVTTNSASTACGKSFVIHRGLAVGWGITLASVKEAPPTVRVTGSGSATQSLLAGAGAGLAITNSQSSFGLEDVPLRWKRRTRKDFSRRGNASNLSQTRSDVRVPGARDVAEPSVSL